MRGAPGAESRALFGNERRSPPISLMLYELTPMCDPFDKPRRGGGGADGWWGCLHRPLAGKQL